MLLAVAYTEKSDEIVWDGMPEDLYMEDVEKLLSIQESEDQFSFFKQMLEDKYGRLKGEKSYNDFVNWVSINKQKGNGMEFVSADGNWAEISGMGLV